MANAYNQQLNSVASILPDSQETANKLSGSYRALIEDAVEEDRLEEALSSLQDFVRNLAPSLKDQVLMLRRRHHQFRLAQIGGTAKEGDGDQIVATILKITSEAERLATVIPVRGNLEDFQVRRSQSTARVLSQTATEEGSGGDPGGDRLNQNEDNVQPLDENLRTYWRRYRDSMPPEQTVAFECKSISKRFKGSRFELNDLSFSLRTGQITGVVGRNASGKTTLLRMVLGDIAPDRGSLSYPLLTRDDTSWSHIKRQIAYISQLSRQWGGRVGTNLSFIASSYGSRGARNKELVAWHIQRYGLADYQKSRWGELSGGYRARYELARALVSRPKLLVLDEPLASLDVIAQQEFLKNLRAIAYSLEDPVPVIITSQHLYEIEAIVDQLIVLDGGKCLFCGSLADLKAESSTRFFELTTSMSRRVALKRFEGRKVRIAETLVDGFIVEYSGEQSTIGAMRFFSDILGNELTGIREITGSSRRFFLKTSNDG
jgi:ABC-2 type transport system ATP-binding protein